jgi:nitrous oxidase accessory protein NosD
VDCRGGADLQAAIDAAAPGDTLSIVGRCDGNFVIDRSLTIQGAGGASTVEGDGSGPAVLIHHTEGDIAVHLVGLTITGGAPGVRLDPARDIEITVARSSISANPGGGLFMDAGFHNVVTITDSVLRGNGEFGAWNHGSPSSMRLERVTVRDTAGDGVISDDDSGLAVLDSTIRDNTGTGLFLESAGVSVTGSTIRVNLEGGIRSGTYRNGLILRSSRILDNRSSGDGGGIWFRFDDMYHLRIEDTVIANNTAAGRGGGLYLVDRAPVTSTLDGVIFRNDRAASGGGIFHDGAGTLSLTDVTFTNDTPDDCVGC